jgi:hypothetical protein
VREYPEKQGDGNWKRERSEFAKWRSAETSNKDVKERKAVKNLNNKR